MYFLSDAFASEIGASPMDAIIYIVDCHTASFTAHIAARLLLAMVMIAASVKYF